MNASDLPDRVLRALKAGPNTSRFLSERFGKSRADTVGRVLRELEARGLVRREGKGTLTTWYLNRPPPIS